MRRRRISHSPLLDPTVCAVILMAPLSHDLLSRSPGLPAWHDQRTAVIAEAAGVVGVPMFTCSWRPEPQASVCAGQASRAPQRQFLLEEYQCPWFNRSFVDALASEDVSRLIVAGFWLEHEVLGTALHALAASYDVAILVDLTRPRSAHAAHSARERLGQAGATPIVTSQLIREWMLAAPSEVERAALKALLPPPRPL
jgi:nicotinamidase-related amidase